MAVIVNGTRIENSVIEKEVERLRPEYEKNVPAQKPEIARFHLLDQAKKNLLERVLISQESEANGPEIHVERVNAVYNNVIDKNGGEKKFLKKYNLKVEDVPMVKKDLEHQLRHEELINQVTSGSDVNDDEAREYYDKNGAEFIKSGRVKASHIVANIDEKQTEAAAREIIEKARKQLELGNDFSAVAKKYSSCPSKGGSLGWFPRGQMVQEFEDVVFSQEVGTTSDIFRSPFGYHIALVEEREEDETIPFEQIKDRLKSHMKMLKAQGKMEVFVNELRKKATIREE
jgi:parvulin-like peptidyl-prolyl isomerase